MLYFYATYQILSDKFYKDFVKVKKKFEIAKNIFFKLALTQILKHRNNFSRKPKRKMK